MSKRHVGILNIPELPCPKVLLYVFVELSGAFERLGHPVKLLTTMHELTDNMIVLMSHPTDDTQAVQVLQAFNTIAPNAIYLGWYWSKNDASVLKHFVSIYENFHNLYAIPDRIPELLKVRNYPYHVPLLLRANDSPCSIGTYNSNRVLDYCYMGWYYCPELVPTQGTYSGIYHASYDHNQFLPYDKRREIYLSSFIALGFQSETNIVTEHVSQRIYEGMAYGCVVLTNSPAAVSQTKGNALYVTSREQIEHYIDYYKSHPNELQAKQESGYDFIREQGTNHYSLQVITEVIEQQMGLSMQEPSVAL